MWRWFSRGGIIMYPLLLCSVLALGVILERIWSFRIFFREARRIVEEDRPFEEREHHLARLMGKMESGLPVLETIVTAAPMLGLLGTVHGIIKTFNLLGEGIELVNKANLAGGLAEALITTEAGLIIALPSLVAANYFRRRIERFVEWGNRRLAEGSKVKDHAHPASA